MDWAAPYHAKRHSYWPEVEAYFRHLPPHLYRQGVLLQNNLATFYTTTGQFKDILSRQRDHPLLYLHFWLLKDLTGLLNLSDLVLLERHLFLAMLYAFAAVYTRQTIYNPDANFTPDYLALADDLARQSHLHLAHLFRGDAPFWPYHQAFWRESTETTADTPYGGTGRQPPTGPLLPPVPLKGEYSPTPPPPYSFAPLAFTKIPIAAVAFSLGFKDDLPALVNLLDNFNSVYQTLLDISTLRRDLAHRRHTYPILRTMQAAGLDPQQPHSAERILGALVLTGVVEQLGRESRAVLAECRNQAETLNWPTFAAYLPVIENWINDLRALFNSVRPDRPAAPKPAIPAMPLFAPFVDTQLTAIKMAQGYLLSDLTFRESWEVQRRGLYGQAELTARAFPAGLIVEILGRNRHHMAEPVDQIFADLQAADFRYYPHPHVPPDSDDLGLLLRLYPYSNQPELHREMLQPPLRWLEASVEESGRIPVWLHPPDDPSADYPRVARWGHHCAAVEANLLLGLLAYDPVGYSSLIQKSARQWSQRIIARGDLATHHYVPLYALWVALALIAQLKLTFSTSRDDLGPQLNRAAQTLAERLTREARRPHLTPQDVAFLLLANQAAGEKTLKILEPLRVYLCQTQRYDGSWAGEPLYATPTRGEFAAWYSSRLVTTAFCYHALKTYNQDEVRH